MIRLAFAVIIVLAACSRKPDNRFPACDEACADPAWHHTEQTACILDSDGKQVCAICDCAARVLRGEVEVPRE